MDKRVIS